MRCSSARAEEVGTQFIFGFTAGADVGELGEKEIESETVGRFGKRDGSYTALESQLRAEFTPNERVRFEIGIPFAYHDIGGVTGLDDRRRGASTESISRCDIACSIERTRRSR